MGFTHDSGTGCLDGCTQGGRPRVWQAGMQEFQVYDAAGQQVASVPTMNAYNNRARALRVRVRPDRDPIIDCSGNPTGVVTGLIWCTGATDRANIFGGGLSSDPEQWGALSLGNRRGATWNWWIEFPEDVHWGIGPGSFQDGNGTERLIIRDGADEFVRGQGANRLTGEELAAWTYRDNSGAGSRIWYTGWRRGNETGGGPGATKLFTQIAAEGLSSRFSLLVRYAPDSAVAQPCEAFITAEGCTPGSTPRFIAACESVTDDPDWMSEFVEDTVNPAWEYSTDQGVTWAAAPASAVHPATPDGTLRWRTTVTIPAGYDGFWRVQVLQGDMADGGVTGTLWQDSENIGASNVPGGDYYIPTVGQNSWHSDYTAVEAGTHVIEWREGATVVGGETHPRIRADYEGVVKIGEPRQILECMNDDGTILSTRVFDYEGNEVTVPATSTVSQGICS